MRETPGPLQMSIKDKAGIAIAAMVTTYAELRRCGRRPKRRTGKAPLDLKGGPLQAMHWMGL
jgi:hypothetical protein